MGIACQLWSSVMALCMLVHVNCNVIISFFILIAFFNLMGDWDTAMYRFLQLQQALFREGGDSATQHWHLPTLIDKCV